MAHACSSQSLTIVTTYDTLGPSGVEHALRQTKPAVMYIDPHLLKTASGPLKATNTVKHVIYNDATIQPVSDSELEAFRAANPSITLHPISSLLELGKAHPVAPTPPPPDSLFCVMYTSGSSGPPKGVPVLHAGFVAAVAGLHAVVADCVDRSDTILAYLPLAHILELALENLVLFFGAALAYGNPRTLSDAGVRASRGDLAAARPTIMVGVPAVWETLRKGVAARVSAVGAVKRAVFWGAYAVKRFLVRRGLPLQGLLDGVAFGAVRASAGGRLRFVFNGASGVSAATREFISLTLAPMIGGYGLTETCGCGALGSPLQWEPAGGAVGTVPASVEVKLVSRPELGYEAGASPPRGEMLIRGLPVLREYFLDAAETAAAITADGWFRTGDVGEVDSAGRIAVIDRVKNLVKLSGGEYVALEKLEAVFRGARSVNHIMVYGDSEHARPVAVVSPNEAALADLAKREGVDEHKMYSNARVRSAVMRELAAVGKAAGLSGMEMLDGVVLAEEEWTPASVRLPPFPA
jgi:long-chain acyl-CoA synthetase